MSKPANEIARLYEIDKNHPNKHINWYIYQRDIGDKLPLETFGESNLKQRLFIIIRYLEKNNKPLKGVGSLAKHVIDIIRTLIRHGQLDIESEMFLRLLNRLNIPKDKDSKRTINNYKFISQQIEKYLEESIPDIDIGLLRFKVKSGISLDDDTPTRIVVCHHKDLADPEVYRSLEIFFLKYPGKCKFATTSHKVKELCKTYSSIKTLYIIAHTMEPYRVATYKPITYGCFVGTKTGILIDLVELLKSDELENIVHISLVACKSAFGMTWDSGSRTYKDLFGWAKFRVEGVPGVVDGDKIQSYSGYETAYFISTASTGVPFLPSSAAYALFTELKSKFVSKDYCITGVPWLIEPEHSSDRFVGKIIYYNSRTSPAMRSIRVCSPSYWDSKVSKWSSEDNFTSCDSDRLGLKLK